MVKKLVKHEFSAYMRIMVPTYIVLLGIALMGRIIQFFEFDLNEIYSVIYDMIFQSSVVVYVIAVIAAVAIAAVFAIIRFYKNLFTGEGYLSFSLPVTVSQHILVKVFVAVAVLFITLLVAFISLCIITFGETTLEIFKAAEYILRQGGIHSIFYVLEGLIFLAVSAFSSILLYYLFIAIGQLFNKNRVFVAVGAYFGYYIIVQVISTVISILLALFGQYIDWDGIFNFVSAYPYECAHGALVIMILWEVVWGGIYFLITERILTKRLNLE